MSSIHIKPILTWRDKRIFLTFPWWIYQNDPLWVPPILSDRAKVIDSHRGPFFEDGHAEFFIAWLGNEPVGTICCAEDYNNSRKMGFCGYMFGFFECIENYAVAEALLQHAENWARRNNLKTIYGPYNLDREDSRGLLVEGTDRPPVILCGHNQLYYEDFFSRYGLPRSDDDGLAYAVDVDLTTAQMHRLSRLAKRVRKRKNITIRSANFNDLEGEIDNVLKLQNRALAHLPGFTPFTRASIKAMIRPMLKIADPDLVLFAEYNGQTVGWFPGIPNFNEILIHVNGLRYPWDYFRLLWHSRNQPNCIAVKSIAVLPEYWDTGVAVLLFDEMAKRAAAKGYTWADMSITGEDNPDTFALAHYIDAKIYKRYRFYRKKL